VSAGELRGIEPKLSVLIPCFNNEDIIEDCLRQVTWADEIVVCDSFSTDRTVEIARQYTDRILQHEYRNSATQKNWAIPQVSHAWILIVDTDERVTPDLRDEIEDVLSANPRNAGFRIPRANYLFGRWLRHGENWPDYQLRLFLRDRGRYEGREVHAHVLLEGEADTLTNPFLHYPHRSLANLRQVILQRYTTWEAMEKNSRGVQFRWYHLLVRPSGAFVQRYILKQGFRDGWQGLLMAGVWACYVFITYVKLRRLQQVNVK
jgi:glycosyltransferase involved in cell wall biosynthesis